MHPDPYLAHRDWGSESSYRLVAGGLWAHRSNHGLTRPAFGNLPSVPLPGAAMRTFTERQKARCDPFVPGFLLLMVTCPGSRRGAKGNWHPKKHLAKGGKSGKKIPLCPTGTAVRQGQMPVTYAFGCQRNVRVGLPSFFRGGTGGGPFGHQALRIGHCPISCSPHLFPSSK